MFEMFAFHEMCMDAFMNLFCNSRKILSYSIPRLTEIGMGFELSPIEVFITCRANVFQKIDECSESQDDIKAVVQVRRRDPMNVRRVIMCAPRISTAT